MQYDGAQLFATYCANCHGEKGEGNRTLTTAMLNFTVPDLSLIRYRAGGAFPREEVRKVIAGTSPRESHSSRTMPVWAWQFYDTKSNNPAAERERAATLIGRLVDHVESLQHDPGR
jgi:mono/diheme cytochrome c family protein